MLEYLRAIPLHAEYRKGCIQLKQGKEKMLVKVLADGETQADFFIPEDLLVREPLKLAALLQAKFNGNRRVFARNCALIKLNRPEANAFLDRYHLMGSTQSAANYGLSHKGELLAVASFSKGRKMRRLPADLRSFELIRFCCKAGYSVTGGLSKLLRHFAREKGVGDIMTYVDAQWSEGASFVKAGFRLAGKTEARYYLVNRKTFERRPAPEHKKPATKQEYLLRDKGNIKLIFPVWEARIAL